MPIASSMGFRKPMREIDVPLLERHATATIRGGDLPLDLPVPIRRELDRRRLDLEFRFGVRDGIVPEVEESEAQFEGP